MEVLHQRTLVIDAPVHMRVCQIRGKQPIKCVPISLAYRPAAL